MSININLKIIFGSVVKFLYNDVLTYLPSRKLRMFIARRLLGSMGDGCAIHRRVRFLHGPRVHLAKNVIVNHDCILDGRHHTIRIGSNVSLGPSATILTLGHDPQSPTFGNAGGDVIIGDYVWVAYGAIVLPGVTLGKGSVVAAGAVVVKDVPEFTIVAGVPAKPIGKRNRDLNYELVYFPWLS